MSVKVVPVGWYSALQAEVARLTRERDEAVAHWHGNIQETITAQAERNTAEAEVARLREALAMAGDVLKRAQVYIGLLRQYDEGLPAAVAEARQKIASQQEEATDADA